MSFILGIDTGGTYTDGVIIEPEKKKIHTKAKALTRREDLLKGISECLDTMDFHSWDEVQLVALSTTLATNSIVEGRRGRVALLVMGESIKDDIPAEYIVRIPGHYNIKGEELEKTDEASVKEVLKFLKGKIDGVAISGYASVRNPRHEKLVAAIVKKELDLPVVCGHELTSSLGFYQRSVTAVLNAGLIPVIKDLLVSTKKALEARNVKGHLMVVKGDGTLMTDEKASEKPIDTILSGPAASVIGAGFLTGVKDGMVIDIGGTTCDIACIEDGKVRIKDDGAKVGGWHTRAKAAEISTFALGGDSQIKINSKRKISIGPRKVQPISLMCKKYKNLQYDYKEYLPPDEVKEYIERVGESYALSEDSLDKLAVLFPSLTSEEKKLLELLSDGPHSLYYLSKKLDKNMKSLDFKKMVDSGLLEMGALTPTDILVIKGIYKAYNPDPAKAICLAIAKSLNMDLNKFTDLIMEKIHYNFSLYTLQSIADFHNYDIDLKVSQGTGFLLDHLFANKLSPFFSGNIEIKKPLVIIGAPAENWMRDGDLPLKADCFIPENSEVANAVGAAVGKIAYTLTAKISFNGKKYVLNLPEERHEYKSEEEADFYAVHLGRMIIQKELAKASCDKWEILEDHKDLYNKHPETSEKIYIGKEIRMTGFGKYL